MGYQAPVAALEGLDVGLGFAGFNNVSTPHQLLEGGALVGMISLRDVLSYKVG